MAVKKQANGKYAVIVGEHDTKAGAMSQDKAAGKDKGRRASMAKGKTAAKRKTAATTKAKR